MTTTQRAVPAARGGAGPLGLLAEFQTDPLGLLTKAADALAVRACLEAIDGSQRQCLALAYYHGLTHAEMAAHLGSPIGSVKVWLRRGLEKLRRCLDRAR